MLKHRSILDKSIKLLFCIFIFALLASCTSKTPINPPPSSQIASLTSAIGSSTVFPSSTMVSAYKPKLQGFSPFGIVFSKDGEYAFVSFNLSEKLLKVRLSDLSVTVEADLSDYFPLESQLIAIDQTGTRIFLYSAAWQKLLILDASTLTVIHTIEDIGIAGMLVSSFGPTLITWGGGPVLNLIDTQTFAIKEVVLQNEFVIRLAEDRTDQDKWYLVSGSGPGISATSMGIYDWKANKWIKKVALPKEVNAGSVFEFIVLQDTQKAYVSTFGGWYPDYHAYGSLASVDLKNEKVSIMTIDGGALCLEASRDGSKLFIGTGWPMPNDQNILVLETSTDKVVNTIDLGKNLYNQAFTQMDTLKIDPTDDNVLYATNGDANAIVKIDLNTLKPLVVNVLNQQNFEPLNFVRQPGRSTGYVLIHKSASSLVLDVDQARIAGVDTFPNIRKDAYFYDVAVNSSGKIFIAQGESILEVDQTDKRLIKTVNLPKDIGSVWNFILSRDEKHLFTVSGSSTAQGTPDTFLSINTSIFQIDERQKLEGGVFCSRPFELPDGSKLYIAGGEQNGNVIIHVLEPATGKIQKTITFNQPGLQGITGNLTYPYSYDPARHILYVGATQVVLGIDTDKDEIAEVIHLGDIPQAIGLKSGQFTYLNATGLVFNPKDGILYIAHGDRSFVNFYDTKTGKFLPQAISLKGFFPMALFPNDDFTKLYTLNSRSDSISVIDVNSKTVVDVIDLHAYLP